MKSRFEKPFLNAQSGPFSCSRLNNYHATDKHLSVALVQNLLNLGVFLILRTFINFHTLKVSSNLL